MSKIFALLAVLLIVSGAILLAAPRPELAPEAAPRSAAPTEVVVPSLLSQAREVAEKVNAPLSIVFGLVSLFYSRRTYQVAKQKAEREQGAGSA